MIKKSYNLVAYDWCCAIAIMCAISLPLTIFLRASYTPHNAYMVVLFAWLHRIYIFLSFLSLSVVIAPIIAFVARFGFNQGLRLFLSKKAIQEQLLDNRTSLLTDDTTF